MCSMLVNVRRSLQPEALKVGVDFINVDTEELARCKLGFADDRVVDMRGSAAEVVEIGKGVQYVQAGALD